MSDEGSRKTILAVDDAPENLDVVKSILVPEYTVMAAIKGTMALKIAEARLPDLILLDVMMPEMDGYEVCKRRHAKRRGTTDRWLANIIADKPTKVAAVALANKMARIAWVLLRTGQDYQKPALTHGT